MTEKEIGVVERSLQLVEHMQHTLDIKEKNQKDNFKYLAMLFGVFMICMTVILYTDLKASYEYQQEIKVENTSNSNSKSEVTK